jgi:poly(3-hydroxybutyrate) depolymerase
MKSHGLFAVAIAMSLVAPFAQTKVTFNMQIEGKTRNCVVHVPSGTNKPPVVFFIHGANGSGAAFESETKGDVTADREKFIAAYPSASSTGATGTWDDMSGKGNFPFFQAIIDSLDARYKIDRNRIYMTGFSQGGFISFAAGCFYSDVFAAVAPVSGHSNTTCTVKRPVPMFMTFGAQEGAASFLKDLDVWLKVDSCPTTSTLTKPYPTSNANSKVSRVSYGPCSHATTVIMDSIVGQGHQWPSSNNLVQADEVWAFFKQYSLANATAIQKPKRKIISNASSASHTGGMIGLRGIQNCSRVRITDTKGRLMEQLITTHDH